MPSSFARHSQPVSVRDSRERGRDNLTVSATMAEHEEETVAESSLMETIKEKLPRADCSSSSDSDDEKSSEPSAADAVKANIYHLFGREKAVHQVLGGGKRTETIKEKLPRADCSSSTDSDDEKSSEPSAADAVKAKIYHLFGREKAVHQVLGGGQPADVFLWRNKKVSAVTLGGATAIWILFELMEYHLLTLACHGLILYVAIRYLWSKATTLVNKSPPQIPKVIIPEDLAVNIALSLRYEINRGFAALEDIASGRHLKKFLAVIAGLWLLSIIGNCCNFLTLFYIAFVTLHTVPVLYEKYEDKVDAFAEKAQVEFKKHYAVIHAKYLSKIPKGPLKDKKF